MKEIRLVGCVVVLSLALAFFTPMGLRRPSLLDIGVVVLAGAILMGLAHRPMIQLVVASALAVLHQAGGGSIIVTMPTLIVALYACGVRTDRRAAWTATALSTVVVAGSAAVFQHGPILGPTRLGAITWIGLAAALGDSVRNRRAYVSALEERADRAERTREEEAARRVAEERVRIARELHDVVAHELTLINAQAGIGAHVGRGDSVQMAELLVAIRESSRGALDELRLIVGLLGQAGEVSAPREPAPGLEMLDELAKSFARAGLRVDVVREGDQQKLSSAADVNGYRIVQEALTNVSKHARTDHATVKLAYSHDTLRITIENQEAPTALQNRGQGSGRGLIGIRERATAAGGSTAIGPKSGGGFVVDVRLPVGRGRATEGTSGRKVSVG